MIQYATTTISAAEVDGIFLALSAHFLVAFLLVAMYGFIRKMLP